MREAVGTASLRSCKILPRDSQPRIVRQPRDVAAGAGEAGDEPSPDRVDDALT